MYSKKSLVLFAAVVLLASPALAANFTDERDRGLSVRQTELDEQYARSHPVMSGGKCFVNIGSGNYAWTHCPTTTVPGTPARPISTYGYVPPHRPTTKH
jgi:hypothetical protein